MQINIAFNKQVLVLAYNSDMDLAAQYIAYSTLERKYLTIIKPQQIFQIAERQKRVCLAPLYYFIPYISLSYRNDD